MPQNRATSYFDQIKFALEHYHDAATLGEASPLAAPYFLGSALRHGTSDRLARGQVLCREIDATLATLWGEALPDDGQALMQAAQIELDQQGRGARYTCLLLELNYLKQRFQPAPRSQSEIYNDFLHISRASHDRYLAAAVEHLGAALLQRLRPALRFEQPRLQNQLIGRQELIQSCTAQLLNGESVTLTGAGGVGKSALGLAIVEEWPTPAHFWFTIRPGVNDSLHSLLFALAYFLQQHGASLLWQQLIADHGQIKDFQLATGLAQSDLRGLRQRPLLCVDEIDLLRRLTLESENPRHTQLLEFIDALRPVAPLLLIGQQSVLESEHVLAVGGLTLEHVAEWLRQQAIPHAQEEVARLHLYTQGNPRLLELCLALYQSSGETLGDALDQLPHAPAVSALWQRLQRRLNTQERQLLALLAVFRTAAPLDAWQAAADSSEATGEKLSERLLERTLLRLDEEGGVFLLPALREVLYHDLPIESRQQLHQQAASLLAQRGEATEAAWHFLAADQPDQAVALWFPLREQEIRRGAAANALAIFEQVSQHRLQGKARQQLALLRAELYQLLGEPEKTVSTLKESDWPADSELSIDAARLWGDGLDATGRSDGALDRYEDGVQRLTGLLNHAAQLYVQRGLLHLRQREMEAARRDANLARFHAERLLGAVADQQGNFEQAQIHYQAALNIAESLQHAPSLAQIHHYLGILAGRHQRMAQALPHFEAAMQHYERIGDRLTREYVRANLASAYIQAGDFAAAVEHARKALSFFQQIGNSFSIALNASNLAEAHAQLNQLEQAQQYAELVLQQEEPHSHPYALFTLGVVQQKRNDLRLAELYFAQSRQLAALNQDRFLLAYAWRSLGEVYLAQEQSDPAHHALQEALTLFREMGIGDEISKTEELVRLSFRP